MFTVEVRDHIMIAHSFRGAVFGPAQTLHGATFVVDAAFIADTLDNNGIVIDIGRAHNALKAVLRATQLPQSRRRARVQGQQHYDGISVQVCLRRLAKPTRAGELGRPGRELKALRITLSESHVARAQYEAPLW